LSIHPSAIVESGAEVDPTAEIGPYAYVGPNVRLAAGVVLKPHSHVTGHTEIGEETQIFPFAAIGEIPQDHKHAGEPTRLVVGARNLLREYVTLHAGTAEGGGVTTIGDDNMILVGAHVGHDGHVGNHVTISNNTLIGGHVRLEDYVVLGASVSIHQFVRIGESAMVAALGGVRLDIAPYVLSEGYPCRPLRVNRINLERRGYDDAAIKPVERAFRIIFRSNLRPQEAFEKVRSELPDSPEAEHMVAFLEKSERGFSRIR
jgi:UDP-N-acetylglucosamine acyltransferase